MLAGKGRFKGEHLVLLKSGNSCPTSGPINDTQDKPESRWSLGSPSSVSGISTDSFVRVHVIKWIDDAL